MPLKGDLGSIDLAHVFQMLSLNQKAGTLEILISGGRTEIYFTSRGVLYPYRSSAFREKVVALLTRRFRLTEDQLDRARLEASERRVSVTRALADLEIIAGDEIDNGYREQMEEEVYEVFFSTDATFEFREGEPLPEDLSEDDPYTLSVNNIIMEAARRVDEWGYIERLVDEADIYEVVGVLAEVPKEERDSALAEVLKGTDGIRTMAGIVEATQLSRYLVCKKMALLVEQGVVAPVPMDVLLERAQSCLQGERVRDAIRLFERAIDSGMADPSVHEMAGLAYQSVGELHRASLHYREVANAFARFSDLRGEAEVHLRIRDLVPIEIESKLRLLEIYRADSLILKPFDYNPVNEVSEAALILRELSRTEAAIKIVRDMVEHVGNEIEDSLRLADLAIEFGDPRTAVETLFQAAERLFAQKKIEHATRIYRRIKAIDPGHAGTNERLKAQLRTKAQRKGINKKRAIVLSTVFVVVTTLGTYVEYSRRAWSLYNEVGLREMVTVNDFESAIMGFKDVQERYPYTLWTLLSKDRVESVSSARDRFVELDRKQDAIDQRTIEERQKDAMNLLAEGRATLRQGRLNEARAHFRSALSLAAGTDWLANENVPEAIEDITQYLEQATSLLETAMEFQAQGEMIEAHQMLVRLATAFPNSPEAKSDLHLPVTIVSDPPGAHISIDGVALKPLDVLSSPNGILEPETPMVVSLPAYRRVELTCLRDGYTPGSMALEPLEVSGARFELISLPDRVFETDFPIANLATDRRYFAQVGGGRVRLVDVKTGDLLWERDPPRVREITAGPFLSEKDVVVAGAPNTLISLSTLDGSERWRASFDAQPRGTIARLDGVLSFVAGKRVMLVDERGTTTRVIDVKSTPVVGPVAVGTGFVVAFDDRRLMMIPLGGGDLKISGWETKLDFDPKVIIEGSSPERKIIVGGRDGEIACLDNQGNSTYQGNPLTRAVDVIIEDSDGLLLQSQTAVVRIAWDGRELAHLESGTYSHLLKDDVSGHPIVVSEGRGVLILDGETLAVLKRYIFPSPVSGVADIADTLGVYLCDDGVLRGILLGSAKSTGD